MNKLILKDELGRAADTTRTMYTLVSNDGKDVLDDPARRCLWWTYSMVEARRMQKIVAKDFHRTVHIMAVEKALVTVALKRYGIEIKPPLTWPNVQSQLLEHAMKGKLNND